MTRRYTLPAAFLSLFVAATPVQGQDVPSAQPAASAESSQPAAARPRRQSWTSSRRSFVEGDVLTVLVDEHTLAAALKGANNSDRRFRDLGVSVGGGPGMPIPDIDAGISSTNSAESRQRGDLTRENRFRGEMSVRIVEIDPRTGLMRIEGSKVVAVDKHREELTLTGWARPQDVSHNNLLDSWRIADAELIYSSTGNLGKPSQSMLSRILSIFWP
ncbi:MAG TPA: flagellar basal body L-ring protein FlgH [Longimicrobiaceae bacterium]